MRFIAGVIVGMLVGRPIVKRVTRPVHPYLADKAVTILGTLAGSIADTCNEYLEENTNR